MEISINFSTIITDYWGLIICEVISGRIHFVPSPIPYNTICYLTIHESYVEKGATQRRGGLHVETPGKVSEYVNIG